MKSIFEQMGGTYSLGKNGMYYPNLVLSEGKNRFMENMVCFVRHF